MQYDATETVRSIRCALVAGAVLCLLGTLLFAVPATSSAQRRVPRRRAALPLKRPSIDYSRFSHATKKHQEACSSCHKVPTNNWKKASDFPDVADYPDHDACIGCHRQQFFRGARPAICSICHSKVSPREDARFAFRNPVSRRQFLIEFPHDKHQDVIAQLWQLQTPRTSVNPVGIRRASFELPESAMRAVSLRSVESRLTKGTQTNGLRHNAHSNIPADQPGKTYNNCAICHASLTNLPSIPSFNWPDGYAPDNVTFKAVPTSHASCFNCHWKSQEPVSDNCSGCHKLTTPHTASESIKRISMKFRHEGGGTDKNHVLECTACHINITRVATLRGLKPDVPITACSECHNKAPSHLEIANELEAIDKNRDFVCTYCHTSNVGRLDPPASHYLIAERPPRKRTDPQ